MFFLRSLLAAACLLTTMGASAQGPLLPDTAGIADGSCLVAEASALDEAPLYRLQFLLRDPAAIRAALTSLRAGAQAGRVTDGPKLTLRLVRNGSTEARVDLYPLQQRVVWRGNWYAFDTSVLAKLAALPVRFRKEKRFLRTAAAYDSFLLQARQEPAFVYAIRPPFDDRGSFSVRFPRNDRFRSVGAIDSLISDAVGKIPDVLEYRAHFPLDERNRDTSRYFFFTISGERRIYEGFRMQGAVIGPWEANPETAWVLYAEK